MTTRPTLQIVRTTREEQAAMRARLAEQRHQQALRIVRVAGPHSSLYDWLGKAPISLYVDAVMRAWLVTSEWMSAPLAEK